MSVAANSHQERIKANRFFNGRAFCLEVADCVTGHVMREASVAAVLSCTLSCMHIIILRCDCDSVRHSL